MGSVKGSRLLQIFFHPAVTLPFPFRASLQHEMQIWLSYFCSWNVWFKILHLSFQHATWQDEIVRLRPHRTLSWDINSKEQAHYKQSFGWIARYSTYNLNIFMSNFPSISFCISEIMLPWQQTQKNVLMNHSQVCLSRIKIQLGHLQYFYMCIQA